MSGENPLRYRGAQERITEFRREILTRMGRDDELALLPSFPRINLAREPGVTARVDSFLGTANPREVGEVYFTVNDARTATLTTGGLPFAVEDPEHPVLGELRSRFDLEHVAGRGPDVDRAIRIRDWIKSQFDHAQPARMPQWNALTILDRGSRGVDSFICIHYSVALVQCCLAIGVQARMVNLHRGISESYRVGDEAITDPPVDEHVVAEVWSSQLAAWVMLDTDYDCHFERDGRPLSAWDIHGALVGGELESIAVRRGPHSVHFTAFGDILEEDEEFFTNQLPAYYAHVSVLMRNDFLSDPDGPVPIAHLVDDSTPPILWHRGSDQRLQPHLMGPVVVAQQWRDTTPVPIDGNLLTGWSSDDKGPHFVELALAGRRSVGRVVLHWPEYRNLYHSSRNFALEGRGLDGAWHTLHKVEAGKEAAFTVLNFEAREVCGVRLVQPEAGGSVSFPDRLWLNQIEVYSP